MLERHKLFPFSYLFLFLSVTESLQLRFVFAIALCGIAIAINFRAITRLLALLVTALATLVPLLLVAQGSVCTSTASFASEPFLPCLVERSLPILANVAMLGSVLVLAAANEWRGSLVETVNGIGLPQSLRIMALISVAMLGQFRRAATRVHHAFAARGDAMPATSWRNLVALPKMVGIVWASVLSDSAHRITGLWASDGFWNRYVPKLSSTPVSLRRPDIVILTINLLLLLSCVERVLSK